MSSRDGHDALGRLRALILEDNPADCLLMIHELRSSGLEVDYQCVCRAQEYASALEGPLDVILADYSLPQFSAEEALAELKRRGLDLPFIVVSGTIREDVAVSCMRLGAADYLLKDRLARLPQAVRHAVGEHRERQAAIEALRQSERRYQTLAQILPVGVFRASPQGEILYANDRWLEIIGLSSQQTHRWQNVLGGKSPRALEELWRDVSTQGVARSGEFELTSAREPPRWVLLQLTPERDAQHLVRGIVGSLTDISLNKQLEKDLRQAKEEAESASRLKDQFLAILSHELRTPLNPVLALVSGLPSAAALTPEDLEMIRRNVELEARLIDDLLDLTRIARGQMILRFEPVNAHDLLERALEMTLAAWPQRRGDVTVLLQAQHPFVLADAARLQQIFWNLIKNACRYSQPSQGILIRSFNTPIDSPASEGLVLEFQDQGVGLSPESLEQLFVPFSTLHPLQSPSQSSSGGGLGLGLAISKALTELLHGHLDARSLGPGCGSTFRIRLPTLAQQVPPSAPPQVPRQTLGPAPTRRILLVEDHADTRRVMMRLLESLHLCVLAADSVTGALSVARKLQAAGESLDLLICDIGLPDGSGLSVMRELHRLFPSMEGLALSGYGMEEDLQRSREAGFRLHLTKPIQFQRLQEELQRLEPASRESERSQISPGP